MTLILGIEDKKNKKIYVGADSLVTYGYTKLESKEEKIWFKDKILFGAAGSARYAQAARHMSCKKIKKKQTLFDYLGGTFLPTLYDYLESFKVKPKNYGFLVVAYKDELYEVCPDFYIHAPADGVVAIGCGDELAIGALSTMGTLVMSAEDKINTVLEKVSNLSIGVGPPFKILHT